jgi:hypothetical protein
MGTDAIAEVDPVLCHKNQISFVTMMSKQNVIMLVLGCFLGCVAELAYRPQNVQGRDQLKATSLGQRKGDYEHCSMDCPRSINGAFRNRR